MEKSYSQPVESIPPTMIAWDDFALMDRIARDARARQTRVIFDGVIVPDPTYDEWRAEYERRQEMAACAWARGECCGDVAQRQACGWCMLARGGCHACEHGRRLASMVE